MDLNSLKKNCLLSLKITLVGTVRGTAGIQVCICLHFN